MSKPTAVVLFNLGGPSSLEAVEGFLFNLFSDRDIFQIPLGTLLQKPFAYLVSKRRAHEAKTGYAAIGGRSPLLENTQKQADALQRSLAAHGAFDVFVCMRYWHPLTQEVVADLQVRGYERVVLLPLYPQYSRTTTGSSKNEFVRQCARAHYAPRYTTIDRWYDHPDYLDAVVADIAHAAQQFSDPRPQNIRLLFSAHGLPQKLVDAGDPYEQQIRHTYELLTRKLGWPHTTLCYQSRVGPLKWLQPYTEATIRAEAAAGAQQMLVYPIAFVSDHIETLYELGMTYADLARQCGVREYRVVPALNDRPQLIAALTDLTLTAARTL